jgi:hypothetical protein
MTLKEKATVTANDLWDADCTAYYYDVVVTGTTPLVALRSTGTLYTTIVGVAKSGSTWTFRVLTHGAGAQTFTYYVFDRPDASASASAGFGLEVYDDTGAVVWTASQKPLRLVFGNDLSNLASGPTYAHISSTLINQSWANTTEDGVVFFTDWSIYAEMYVCTSTGVTQSTVTVGSGTKPGANNEPRPLGAGISGGGYQNTERFVVDVTNY